MKIKKDEIEITVETPITKLRKDLSEYDLDFSVIKTLQGEKNLLRQAFLEVFNESIKD